MKGDTDKLELFKFEVVKISLFFNFYLMREIRLGERREVMPWFVPNMTQ